MKELRTILRVLSLVTLSLFFYGAFTSEGAAVGSPAITITEPVHGALVQGKVTVAVSFRSASGVNVTDLEFYVDKALFKRVKLDPPTADGKYQFEWDTSRLDAGVHTITALAIDAKGQPGNVAVSVYVDTRRDGPDTQAPTVSLKAPANGAVVSGVVQLVANALDNAGVGFVLFFVDDRMLFGTNHPPYEFDWDTTKVPNGQHSIRVYAYDAAQNTGESTPIVVTVNNPGGQTQPGERLSQAVPTPVSPTNAGAIRPQRAVQPDLPVKAPAPQPPAKFAPGPQMATVPALPAPPKATTPPGSGQGPATAPSAPPPSQPDIVAFLQPASALGGPSPSATTTPARAGKPSLAVPPTAVGAPSLSSDPMPKRRPQDRVGSGATRVAKAATTVPASAPARVAPSVGVSARRPQAEVSILDAPARGSLFGLSSTSQRVTMPWVASSPFIDAAASRPQVVAVVVAGPAAGMVAPSASAARVAAPAELAHGQGAAVTAQPAGKRPQLAAQPGTPVALGTPAGSPSRVSVPSKERGQPLVTLPPGSAGSVVVARLEPTSRRSLPVAVISVQHTQPTAARIQQGAAPSGGRMVVSPRAKGPISVVLNGQPVKFDRVTPFTEAGIMFTPFRHIVEHQGGSVRWNNLIKQVRASTDGRRIEFTIGDPHAVVNNQTVEMQVAPALRNGRAVVPLSFVRDALDVVVEYDPASGRITIAAK